MKNNKVKIKWNKYNDKQPNKSGMYIVCLDNETVILMLYVKEVSSINDRWARLNGNYIFNDNPVMFWSKLPKSPICKL